MKLAKLNLRWILIVVAALFNAAAVAGGGGGGMGGIVFDPTNYGQNIITAAQSVSAEAQRAAQYAMQLRQYATQVQNLSQLANPQSVTRDFTSEIGNTARYIGTLNNLYGDLSNLQNTVQRQFQEQAMSGLTWDQYAQREAILAQRQKNSAQAIFAAVQASAARVDRDYEQMQAAQSATLDPQNAGAQAQMQIMNQQLNQVVSQNRDLVTGISALNQLQAEKTLADAADRERARQRDADRQAAQAGADAAAAAALQRMNEMWPRPR